MRMSMKIWGNSVKLVMPPVVKWLHVQCRPKGELGVFGWYWLAKRGLVKGD